MLKVLFHSSTGGFKISILFVSFILMNLDGCKSIKLYKIQGQEANLIFPYPCESTEVTLQHSHRVPFYRLTDGSMLSYELVHRFHVQNRIEDGNCSLDLTISNLKRSDAGTYLSTIYKEGELCDDYTTRVGLQVDYPPGEASCVVGYDKGGDWVSVDCTANVESSVSGKIECYQNGVWMPPLSDLIETDTSLKQTILIRKSHPVFCCSSTLDEYKERCECKDTGLYIADNDSNDPCPPLEITTMPLLSTLTEINQSDFFSTMTSSIPVHTTKCNSKNYAPVVIHSIAVLIEVIVLILSLFFHYKIKTKIRNNNNVEDPPIPSQLNISLLNGQKMKNGSSKHTEFAS